ncbi:hypothetical protein D3C73_933470 [compost metagenome]
MSSTDQRADSFASILSTRSRNGAATRSCRRSVWLYWRWSPSRRMNTTSRRATCCDSAAPTSRSINAKARSMPAVTPADVQYLPLSMKMRSSCTRRAGCICRSRSAERQCVVTARPSSRPAAASTKAPVHTLHVRGARASRRRNQAIVSGWALARSAPGPPGTSSMSMGASPSCSKVPSTCMRRPCSQVLTMGVAAIVLNW